MIRHIALTTLLALATGLALLIFILPTPSPTSDSAASAEARQSAASPASGRTLLRAARLLIEGRLSEPRDVLMEDGLIQQIEAAGSIDAQALAPLEVIEGEGLVALPGLIDSHTHSYGSSLADALRFGVTVNLDMFADRSLLPQARLARNSVAPTRNADLFSAGMLATAPGGHGTQYGVAIEPLTGAEQATAWVSARKTEGSDYIKLVYMPGIASLPSIDRATAQAVISAAHAEGLMALAHISTRAAALDMIEDGIDGLVHVFADEPVNDELLRLAQAQEVFVIPTLAVIEAVAGGVSPDELLSPEEQAVSLSPMQEQTLAASFGAALPGYQLELALQNVKALFDAGVPILAGSDAPNPGTAQGLSLHRELQLLVRAGLSESQAIAAATTVPAEVFDLQGRGVIAPGARADLLLLRGNPLGDIEQTLAIAQVIKNGQTVDQAMSPAASEAIISSARLGDFEAGMTAPDGFAWSATDDSMVNGASTATVEQVAGGAGGSAYALRIDASVQAGFPYPWAGGAIMSAGATDISQYQSLSFSARGTPGAYRLMMFNPDALGVPPTVNFTVGSDWETITVRLSDLEGADPARLVGFAFVAGPGTGESTIYLDDVKLLP